MVTIKRCTQERVKALEKIKLTEEYVDEIVFTPEHALKPKENPITDKQLRKTLKEKVEESEAEEIRDWEVVYKLTFIDGKNSKAKIRNIAKKRIERVR